jgi:hypothetical protein
MWPKSLYGYKTCKRLTNTMKKRFVFHGVLNFEWMSLKNEGNKPSLLIVENTTLSHYTTNMRYILLK